MKDSRQSRFSGIHIRNHLVSGDIGTIIAMHGKLYHEGFGFGLGFEVYVAQSFAEFAGNFNKDQDHIWLAEEGEDFKGFISLVDRGKGIGQLRYFIITPDYRGKGLGKFLFDQLLAHAKTRGFKKLYLFTTNNLEVAASLYKKAGFALSEERQSNSFGIPLLEQRYELHL